MNPRRMKFKKAPKAYITTADELAIMRAKTEIECLLTFGGLPDSQNYRLRMALAELEEALKEIKRRNAKEVQRTIKNS